MMRDRGYTVNESDLSMTMERFTDTYPALMTTGSRHALSMLFQHGKESKRQLFVFFPDGSSVSVKDIKVYISMLEEQKISGGIIVCRDKLSHTAVKAIEESKKSYDLEVFYMKELLFNVTHHEYVPKHILLTDEEKEEVLRERKVSESKARKILITDPVARYYGGKRGQMFRIIRESETAGKSVDYRVVE
jgi:DNA-directed RNA polymerases I, II, and III subunit RPABC1